MAQLIVAAAGAAIGGALAPAGFALLGMSGAQLGWMAGSMLGALANKPPAQQGPRLDDSALRVTGTEYGQGIPWIAGAPRLPGILVWASDRRETSTTEEVGKGGGQEYTTYTYDIDVLYVVADQPGCLVTRIWQNGKLVWTTLATSDDASRLASEGFGASITTPGAVSSTGRTERWSRVTVYDGRDTQLPDPTYEAAVTNAPAYRGRTTVFIEGLQLGNSGSLPNFTFEVSSKPGESDQIVRRHQVGDLGVGNRYWTAYTNGIGYPVIRRIKPSIAVEAHDEFAINTSNGRSFDLSGNISAWPSGYNPPTIGVFRNNFGISSIPVCILDGQAVRLQRNFTQTATGDGNLILSVGISSAAITNSGTDITSVLPPSLYVGAIFPCSDEKHICICTAQSSSYGALCNKWWMVKRENGQTLLVSSGNISATNQYQISLGVNIYGLASFSGFGAGALEDDLEHLWWAYGAGMRHVAMYTIGSDGVMRQASVLETPNGIPSSGYSIFGSTSCWAESGYCVVICGGTYSAFRRVGTEIREVTLRTVVQDLCSRSGMPAGTYDASALSTITRPVRALAIPQVSSTRATLDMLMTSHGFVAALADKLYFFPRGTAVDATVAWGDLGAGEGDASDDPLALEIGGDLELPAQMAVQYRNMAADQQAGVEYSDRIIAGQASTQPVQLALGMLPAEAKGVADVLQLDGIAAGLSATISVPLDYAKLWPGSVVQVTGWDGTQYRMRVRRREDDGVMMKLDLVGDDPSALTSQQVTSGNYDVVTTVRSLDGTAFEVLDIPILRDDDDALGYYVAARSQASGRWPGAVVQASRDGVSFGTVATVSEEAVIGTATSVLQAWAGGHVMDEISFVDVSVGAGQLSSVTRDQLLSDATLNAILVGSEVIRFVSAQLTGTAPNRYRLTRLLRGQRGTEWAMGSHVNGERVVLLQARGLRRVASEQADLAVAQQVRAATLGTVASDATPRAFTLAGIGRKPFAPTNLRKGLDEIGRSVVTWERRTRRQTVIRNGVGITHPLGEASEAYEVDVFNASNALVQTIATTARSVVPAAPVVIGTFAREMRQAFVYGSHLYGLASTRLAKALTSTRAIVAESPSAAEFVAYGRPEQYGIRWVCHDSAGTAYIGLQAEDMFGSIMAQRIVKIDLASMTSSGVIDYYNESGGCQYDIFPGVVVGSHLYVGGYKKTGSIEITLTKILTSTMSHVSTITVGQMSAGLIQPEYDGSSDIVMYGVDGSYFVRINPLTMTEISRYDFGVGRGNSVKRFGTVLVCSAYGESVSFIDLSSNTLILNTSYPGELVVEYDGKAAINRTIAGPFGSFVCSARIFNPTTGAIVGNVDLGTRLLCGSIGTSLLAGISSFPEGTCAQIDPAPSLAGGRAVVYQISATVGRGYPAEITL